MKKTTSLSDYARHRGVSRQAVDRAIRRGKLARSLVDVDGQRMVRDVDEADAEWLEKTTRRVKSKPPAETAEPKNEPAEAQPAGNSLFEEQRAATHELARHRKLTNDEREGRLVPIAIVQKQQFETMRIVRESMLNLPTRIAGELAAETDAAKIARILDERLREALESGADQLLKTAHA